MTRQEYLIRSVELAPRGSQLPQSKLTVELVREIRAEYLPYSKEHGAAAISRRLNLHRRTIDKVLNYETWIHA